MIGGTYLCYEGAEKIWEKFSGHEAKAQDPNESAGADAVDHEKQVVSSATRTDFILSAEIMVIALNEVATEPLFSRAIILLVVAVLITALVYGVVGLIVKMDDAGLALAQRPGKAVSGFGRGLVKAMPMVLSTLSWVGMVAMLWVGGHILLVGADELGLRWRHIASADDLTPPMTWCTIWRWLSTTPPGPLVPRSAGSPTRSSRPSSG